MVPRSKNMFIVAALAALMACEPASDPDPAATSSTDIVGARSASDYPEFVAIDTGNQICSGALIAPRVVLTAGHCAQTRGRVYIKFADGTPSSETGEGYPFQYFDERADEAAIDVSITDVGVIVLDTKYGI